MKRLNFNDKEAVYKVRKENNRLLKEFRRTYKLGRRRTDLDRIRTSIYQYKSNKLSLNKLMKFIENNLKDKFLAGISTRFEEVKRGN